jgi:hypothetical protein
MKEITIRSTHLDDTAQAIARLRPEHDRKATPLQRIVDDLTKRAGSSAPRKQTGEPSRASHFGVGDSWRAENGEDHLSFGAAARGSSR